MGVDLTKLAQSLILAAILSLSLASAAAQALSGTVTNGKPAVGDEVILPIACSGDFPLVRVK
jgi:hypothetical protein